MNKLKEDVYGTECCCNCGNEFDFTINGGVYENCEVFITCSHCGQKQHPCSICFGCSDDCGIQLFNAFNKMEIVERL